MLKITEYKVSRLVINSRKEKGLVVPNSFPGIEDISKNTKKIIAYTGKTMTKNLVKLFENKLLVNLNASSIIRNSFYNDCNNIKS